MYEADSSERGVYRVSSATLLLQTTRRVLDRAVVDPGDAYWQLAAGERPVTEPNAVARAAVFAGSYGWIEGAFPAPEETGRYLVEFIDRTRFRILGYYDRVGRAYAVDEPIASVPDRAPDVDFARFSDKTFPQGELGCVEVRAADGTAHQVGCYASAQGRFSLHGSWYDFGPDAQKLSYDDALARCFFAFYYRAQATGAPVPDRGLFPVEIALRTLPIAESARAVVDAVALARTDAAWRAPALAEMLADELEDSGVLDLSEEDEAQLSYLPETRYSKLQFVMAPGAAAQSAVNTVGLQVETALNRYRMVADLLGERAADVDRAVCERMAASLVDHLVPAKLDRARIDALKSDDSRFEPLDDAACATAPPPGPVCAGEWNMRSSLAGALESIRSPYRAYVQFKSSLADGVVVLSLMVPPGAAMPARRWDAATRRRVPATRHERTDEALRFALRLGIVCAAAAFESAPEIARVTYASGYYALAERDEAQVAAGFPAAAAAVFERDRFVNASDPGSDLAKLEALWKALGGTCARSFDGLAAEPCEQQPHPGTGSAERLAAAPEHGVHDDERSSLAAAERRAEGLPAVDAPPRFLPNEPFDQLIESPRIAFLRDRPEVEDGAIPARLQSRLGARWLHDMRITDGSARRRDAERLADELATSASDTDAVRRVRAFQNASTDSFALDAGTRVMRALVEGTLDLEDQNAVVNCYLGTDEFTRALARAQELAVDDPAAAAETLVAAVAHADEAHAFADTPEVVYRVFDLYASRLLYNLDRCGTLAVGPGGSFVTAGDRGRNVALAPDALFLCEVEAARLMESSFTGVDEAIRLGQRAVALAPTSSLGYRRLARSFMLMGDVESAAGILDRGLRIATLPSDVALSYYQLAYVLWKGQRAQAASACYRKAIDAAPLVQIQAAVELRELLAEGDARPVSSADADRVLADEGIVVAPTPDVLDALLAGAQAATDAGMFACAHSLLASYVRYHADDALVDVLRSLSIEEA